jgi:hypothetical protein
MLLLVPTLVDAAVSGTIVNGTTGKPQAGVPIHLVQPGQQGMQELGSATSAADGTFSFSADPAGPGPVLLQTTYQTVIYTTLITPNQPRTGVQVLIYEQSAKREGIGVDRHGILIEPAQNQLMIREFIFMNNLSKTTYADASNGTYRFYIPKDVETVRVAITPPTGMPLQRPAEKTSDPTVRKISYPLRPGQTQIEIEYAEPMTNPVTFSGNILHKDGETRLIVPRGITLEGEGLERFAPEPQTQSPVYGIKPGPFTVKLVGNAAAPEPEDPDAQSPQVQAHRPRLYERYWWILGLGLAIMTLSLFAMAARGTPKAEAAKPAEPAKRPAKKK